MLQKMFQKTVLSVILTLVSGLSFAISLEVAGFNIEANEADAKVIAKQMAGNKDVELWGLAEARNDYVETILNELNKNGKEFSVILGTTGGSQKLQIFYNQKRFSLLEPVELHDININGRVRAPLAALLYDNQSQQTFYFMVNHLYRSSADARHLQAHLLHDWALSQSVPVIEVGDYNFDLSPEDWHKHDQGFDLMIEGDVFKWIMPETLLPTQCNMHYKSILDFVFVSGKAQAWAQSSVILNPESSYCPDTNQTSDHRPVKAILDL